MLTEIGIGKVKRRLTAISVKHAKALPKTNSGTLVGSVMRYSIVPLLLSSLHIFIVSAEHRKIRRTGKPSNIGRTSEMLRAKNASTQKNVNSVSPKNAPITR